MKFGKRLAAEAARQWSPYYLDYKQVKRAIKDDLCRGDAEGKCFDSTLSLELEKVCSFYLSKEQGLQAQLSKAKNAPGSSLRELQKDLQDLIKFVALNYVAVVKATKKRNRHMKEAFGDLRVKALQPYDILCEQVFFTSAELANVATQVDILNSHQTEAEKNAKDVLSDYQCPICLDVLHSPVVLTCTHRFCWGCLITHCATVKSRAGTAASPAAKDSKSCDLKSSPGLFAVSEVISDSAEPKFFTCPVCRKPHGLDVDGMHVDRALSSFIEGLMNDDCDGTCEEINDDLRQYQSRVTVAEKKLTVLLDLDGTLASSFTPRRAPRLPPSVRTHIVAKGSQLNPQGVFVVERPGLQRFLQELNSFANVVIFTAGLEEYAKPIVSAIDPDNKYFSAVIYRDGCLKTDYYQCVKDIALAGYDLASTVLVDDTPLAFLHQPDNGVPVLPFRGDPDDQLLLEAVLPFLQGLTDATDVQDVLRERFDMSKWFGRHGYPVHSTVSTPSPAVQSAKVPAAQCDAPSTEACCKHTPEPKASTDPQPECCPPQAQTPKFTSTLLLCDFDKTLTDFDAGERLFETLAPELVPMLQAIEMPANFIPITNTLLTEISRRGVSRNLLLSTLQEMGAELPAGTIRMLKHANASNNVQVKVLSDCNRIFIAHMLAGAKIGNLVKEVLTNPAGFERVDDDSSNMGLGTTSSSRVGRKGCMQKLVITPRHACHLPAHGCNRCPENLCKGIEVDRLRAQKPKERIIYCGDGQNDVCPALRLRPGDFVFARHGCALAKFLVADAESGSQLFKGTFKVWENHEQLADWVTELLH